MSEATTAITAPLSVAERVSERIRSTYVELIAEDEWKRMVDREIAWFHQAPGSHYGSSGYVEPEKVSPIRTMIRTGLQDRFKAMVKAELDKPEYAHVWEGHGYKGGDAIQQMTKELTPDLVQQLFQGIVSQAVMTMRNTMQSGR